MDKQAIEWGEIGYIVFKSIYARERFEGDLVKEEWADVIDRELDSCERQLGLFFTPEEQEEYRQLRMGLRCSVAGRAIWQMGTQTVDRLGMASLQNCATIAIDHPVEPFLWAFDMLMLGCGVGFNVQRHYIQRLPPVLNALQIERIDRKDADFIVPDSREGWVSLLRKVLEAYFFHGKGFSYSTMLIRPKGEPIRGFGGVSSGPDMLCQGIAQMVRLLNDKAGQRLSSVDCLDLMCLVAFIVKSGNVRRSALMAIGDHDDPEYLCCKRWDLTEIPNWRSLVNISVECNDANRLPQLYWDSYYGGEAIGLVNIELAKRCGRVGDERFREDDIIGFNPCGEQPQSNGETCNLAEIYLSRCRSYAEFLRCLYFVYRINKHVLALPCHQSLTNDIVHRKMRMGIGVTGLLQCSEEQLSWLKPGYGWLRDFDRQYSRERGWAESIKLTTVKPSGTLSLLAGVTPGAHPSPAGPYYLRRVRMPANSGLLRVCLQHGYEVEPVRNFDGTEDRDTMVVAFPCAVPETTPIAAHYTWRDQLDFVMRLQREWSDNAVSCSIYYSKDEVDDIRHFLQMHYQSEIKSVSFMLKYEHGFVQAPYETISREQYLALKAKTRPIHSLDGTLGEHEADIQECESGACAVK